MFAAHSHRMVPTAYSQETSHRLCSADQAECDQYLVDKDDREAIEREWCADQWRAENPEYSDVGCYVMKGGDMKSYDYDQDMYVPLGREAGEPGCVWDTGFHGMPPPYIERGSDPVLHKMWKDHLESHAKTKEDEGRESSDDVIRRVWADMPEVPDVDPDYTKMVTHYYPASREEFDDYDDTQRKSGSEGCIEFVKMAADRYKIVFYVARVGDETVFIPYKVARMRLRVGQKVKMDCVKTIGHRNQWRAESLEAIQDTHKIELTSNYRVAWGKVIGSKGANLIRVSKEIGKHFRVRSLRIILDTKSSDDHTSPYSCYAVVESASPVTPVVLKAVEDELRKLY
jgi:hypothetical protein